MDKDKFYENLRISLRDSQEFPGNYTFKFIILNKNKLLAELQQIFDNASPNFSTKLSKSNKYISLTVQIFVLDEEYIIEYYQKAAEVESIIML